MGNTSQTKIRIQNIASRIILDGSLPACCLQDIAIGGINESVDGFTTLLNLPNADIFRRELPSNRRRGSEREFHICPIIIHFLLNALDVFFDGGFESGFVNHAKTIPRDSQSVNKKNKNTRSKENTK